MPMPQLAYTDDGSFENIECGEQCGCSRSFVVMRLSLGQAGPDRKDRLCPAKRLNLAFLIDAQQNRFIWRVHIESYDVANLGGKLRIGAELERLHPVRLQFVLIPDPLHRCRTDLLTRRHGAHAPMRSILGGRLHRCLHDRSFPLSGNLFGAPTPRPTFENALYASDSDY